MPRKPLSPCGSYGAYQRHIKAKETVCEPCKVARRRYQKGLRAKLRVPRTLKPCGTPAAYRRHLRHGEKACEPCLAANREAN